MTAQIVFANDSKQMAHNTNDLFERWRLRREDMPALAICRAWLAYLDAKAQAQP